MRQYCDDFNQVLGDRDLEKHIVKNSIPVIWFGDLERYQASPVKIVTVGLNPSWHEFLDDRLSPLAPARFSKVDLSSYTKIEIDALYNTLNAYYDGKGANPYMRYFRQYERLLNGINASYFGNFRQNTAIHIDAYSAMATRTLWGELSIFARDKLKERGKLLYRTLVNYLDPDIILISVARKDFEVIHPHVQKVAEYVAPNKKGVYVEKHCHTSNDQQIILGRNYNGTPFGGRTVDETIQILQKCLQMG